MDGIKIHESVPPFPPKNDITTSSHLPNRCLETHAKENAYLCTRCCEMGRFKCNSYKSLKRRPTSCKGNRKNTNTRFSRVVCILNACIVGRPERRPKINVICLVLTSVM